MRVVIIGAGPTGLGAAAELERGGADWVLLEAEAWPGGLSASFRSDGYTWDIGGHILFSHYPEFDAALASAFPRDAWLFHERRAFVRYLDAWVPYPFQFNLHHLPAADRDACVRGLEEAARQPAAAPANFAEFVERSMGSGLARVFMRPYNRKVWATPLERMGSRWIGERVAIPELERVRRSIRERRDDVGWGPNNRFRFPHTGGTGAIWRGLAALLPAERLRYGCRVVGVDLSSRRVRCADGAEERYDTLISTAPLDRLAEMTGREDLRRATRSLRRTTVHTVGIGLSSPPAAAALDKCWMYFPEEAYPFYRVTVFSNYSPRNAPEGCWSLMAEVAEGPEQSLDPQALTGLCVQGLRHAGLIEPGQIPLHTWCHRAAYGYPVPTLDRDVCLTAVQPVLESAGVLSRGRFGAWKYEVGNMDHSYMQGMEAARRVLRGEPESTFQNPDEVNRGRGSV